jgi:ABC-type glycerol-3-phosphate transport system permease component
LFRQAIVDIPNDFEEAAEIDGASFPLIMTRVYLPMLYPVFGVVLIGMFIGMWNDYMFPMIYAGNNPDIAPIGLYITTLLNAFGLDSPYAPPNYPAIFGISLIFVLPPIIVFILIQDMFVSGMTMGGIKS